MLLMIIPYVFICFAVFIGMALGVESQDPGTDPQTMAFWVGVMVLILVICLSIHVGAYVAVCN